MSTPRNTTTAIVHVLACALAFSASGCCCPWTYTFEAYTHEATAEAQRKLEENRDALSDYTIDGVTVAADFGMFHDGFGAGSRAIKVRLLTPAPASLWVSRATLESLDGSYSVTAPIDRDVTVGTKLYGSELFATRLTLFRDTQVKDTEAQVDFQQARTHEVLVLHLDVGGSKEKPAMQKLTFKVVRTKMWDIAWP